MKLLALYFGAIGCSNKTGKLIEEGLAVKLASSMWLRDIVKDVGIVLTYLRL